MTPRQQRRAQQKAERRAQKLEFRRQNQLDETRPTPIATTIGFESQKADPQRESGTIMGFESQKAGAPGVPEIGFESQPAATIAAQAVSAARLAANRANAQHSCGPKSAIGKRIVSQNRTRHGLTGDFRVLSNECQTDFDRCAETLLAEHSPGDETETEIVRRMAEALWLSHRALRLQETCIETLQCGAESEKNAARKELGLLLRYQTTHDLSFTRYSNELRKRRAERRKNQRGFESQRTREAQESRRQAGENRKREKHEMDMLLLQTTLERAKLPTSSSQLRNLAKKQAA
jgi:hypothetical protein